jgi:hypothetical protein
MHAACTVVLGSGDCKVCWCSATANVFGLTTGLAAIGACGVHYCSWLLAKRACATAVAVNRNGHSG